ncbi:MAG: Na+/H+ antiporter NhaC [Bacteroidales bacterium]|nr:Na+/H+ antiporter NhaC [Candidatus Physcousia equi]
MKPSLWISLLPLGLLVGLIACVVSVFGNDTLAGASQVALLLSSAFCVCIGLLKRIITWEDFEKAVTEKVGGVAQSLIILLLIGSLSGAWMVSGIVPMLIYYGMEIIHPAWFLISACVICAVVSVMTGSSWTTIATIGVALMGIGQTLGFSEGWVAGAIISGAYFGDKISPLSDTTVLAASTSGTPLFTHIRYMMGTTFPTFLITIIIFTVAGLTQDGTSTAQVEVVQKALDATFNLTPWVLVVPVLTGLMIAKRMPSVPVLFLATILALVLALITQTPLLEQIADKPELTGLGRSFRGAMTSLYGSTSLDTGVESLNELVATRGMSGMMPTIWLILCAMIFGAAMTVTGMIERLMQAIIRLVRGSVSLVASTALVGFCLNVLTSDQYLSIILTTTMFKETYLKQGHKTQLLSRSTEDSATVTSVLIPWNTCGMTQSSVLGVSTLTYLPYCFFNYLSPLMTILMARFVRKQ